MKKNILYATAFVSICIIHATDNETNPKTDEAVARLTKHLEELKSMYAQIELIEADLDTYQLENAPTRFDMVSTMSYGRETVDMMLQATQGFLSNVKDYLGGFINFLLSLPSSIICNKPEPMHQCCNHIH